MMFGAIEHHMAWPCWRLSDVGKYSIVSRNIFPRQHNISKNTFSNMDEIY
jgi:hypothetical protein